MLSRAFGNDLCQRLCGAVIIPISSALGSGLYSKVFVLEFIMHLGVLRDARSDVPE